MVDPSELACPACQGALAQDDGRLQCQGCGARYPIVEGIPSLLPGDQRDWRETVARLDRELRRHPWVMAKMSFAACTWLPRARRQILESIAIQPGDVVLDHCTGCGENLPILQRAVGAKGRMCAFDLSLYGLQRAARRLEELDIGNVRLQQADAHALPYPSRQFDAVVHFGAWNQLPGQKRALEEIIRVTRPGGWVVILDEGLHPQRRDSWWGRLLRWGNPLFGSSPPMELFACYAEPSVRWVVRGMFYEVRFRVPN